MAESILILAIFFLVISIYGGISSIKAADKSSEYIGRSASNRVFGGIGALCFLSAIVFGIIVIIFISFM
ncbi:hypothetical protein [Clostridium sp. 3-3]|uniref:hypothetical protein n=1 Tax=Clostridium sp. 3-3 TaxID=2070757 RepID=UPI000CDAB2B8|nr:hypothetical protein [Clostridium sp. 3-3]POO85081.1 hypothetical protein C1H59_17965 [Clostridium sp. 3-3]